MSSERPNGFGSVIEGRVTLQDLALQVRSFQERYLHLRDLLQTRWYKGFIIKKSVGRYCLAYSMSEEE